MRDGNVGRVLSDPPRLRARLLRASPRMSRPPRIRGFSYVGFQRYFLTFCTRGRRRWFVEAAIVSETTAHFLKTGAEYRFAILAYCFMPDHVHLLVEAECESADLRAFVKLAKQRSGAAHALANGGPLWQAGYFDRALRDEEDSLGVARYVLNNPVRAGLVRGPHEYRFWGSTKWTREELLGSI